MKKLTINKVITDEHQKLISKHNCEEHKCPPQKNDWVERFDTLKIKTDNPVCYGMEIPIKEFVSSDILSVIKDFIKDLLSQSNQEILDRVNEANDIILDCWEQFGYETKNGYYSGGLSTLESVEWYLKNNGFINKNGKPLTLEQRQKLEQLKLKVNNKE